MVVLEMIWLHIFKTVFHFGWVWLCVCFFTQNGASLLSPSLLIIRKLRIKL